MFKKLRQFFGLSSGGCCCCEETPVEETSKVSCCEGTLKEQEHTCCGGPCSQEATNDADQKAN